MLKQVYSAKSNLINSKKVYHYRRVTNESSRLGSLSPALGPSRTYLIPNQTSRLELMSKLDSSKHLSWLVGHMIIINLVTNLEI